MNIAMISLLPKKGVPDKDGTQIIIPCPKSVADFNKHMGCVDKADMLKSLYAVDRKSRKWWHRLFCHFVDVTIVNAHILYSKQFPNDKMTLKDFRCSVVTGLVNAKTSPNED
ncbi:hypothetical protein NFI96_029510 [Prochilodus magdalenae]|nr:hypothetical protein NFI96_029510 [Prochilodus magdalenae]